MPDSSDELDPYAGFVPEECEEYDEEEGVWEETDEGLIEGAGSTFGEVSVDARSERRR